MLRNKNSGFVLLDIVVAFSMFLMITITLLPIYKIAKIEVENLKLTTEMISTIYTELLDVTNQKPTLPISKDIMVDYVAATVNISNKNGTYAGCIQWENFNNSIERKCFYVSENAAK